MIFGCSPNIKAFHSRRLFRTVLSALLQVLFIIPAIAKEKEKTSSSNDPAVDETIAKPVAVLYEPNNRRDPFLHIVPPKTAAKKIEDEEVPRGTPPPGIAGTFIDKAELEGIIIRADNRRLAIIGGANNRAYFIREGDLLFNGYLKTIEKDSVIFVRETFMRSGKVLTQEVTKRLRKP